MTPPDFGKRRPIAPDPESQKRSRNVVLLLMGTMAVGGLAYSMMSNETCDPTRPTVPGEKYECPQKSSSSGGSHGSGYGSSSHSSFFSSNTSSSSSGDASSGAHVSRGGFGSFMSHFSGGG